MAAGGSRSSEFDAVVAGGGPAGAAAGIVCALAGLRTCILERTRFPRDRPGESLHPGAETLFRQLGVSAAVEAMGFARHRGIGIETGTAMQFEPFSTVAGETWLGFLAWRAELDHILLERARSLGCEVRQACALLDIGARRGEMWSLRAAQASIRSRFVIDAGGGSHWMARRLRMPVTRLTPLLIAHCAYRTVADKIHPGPLFQECESGWSWRAMARAGLENWTAVSLDPGHTPVRPEGFDPLTHTRTDVTWRFVSDCAGPGYFITGDAAAVIDPAGSHGVLRALMSGILAGNLAAQLCRGTITGAAATECYRQWMLGWFLRDAVGLTSRYARLVRAPAWLSGVTRSCEQLGAQLRNEISPSRRN